MKYKIIIFSVCILVVAASSCKKYGYKYDDGYDPGQNSATATSSTTPLGNDFSKLNVARIFPGVMSTSEQRLTNQVVNVKLTNQYIYPLDIKVLATPSLQYTTGLYAPAGEPILIEVPDGVMGLTAQIGGWVDDLTNLPALNRDPIIYSMATLSPGKNYLRNLYGGSIYIKPSLNSTVKEVSLKISGAVQSPDFVLGQTSDASWNAMVTQSTVPWFKLVGKRVIFELPKYFLDKHPISNPTALVEEWDRIISEDIYRWKKLDDVTTDSLNKAPEAPIWVIMDAQPRTGFAHSSFPVVIQMDENIFTNEITDLNMLKSKGAWRVLSEIGRNNVTSTWSWSTIYETAANLYSLKMANRFGINIRDLNPNMKVAVDTSLWYVSQAKTIRSNFAKDIGARSNADLIKLIPFVQLFKKIGVLNPAVNGYGLMGYMDEKARHLVRQTYSDQEKINMLYQYASEYAKTDLYPFFYYWSMLPSGLIVDTISSKYPKLNLDIYRYNPILDTGGTRAIPAPSKVYDRTGWIPLDFCCQEPQRNFYVSNMFDGDLNTAWWPNTVLSMPIHRPHWFVFDLGKFYDVAGYWYSSFGSNSYLPMDISLYVSSIPLPYDSPDWIPADLNWNDASMKINNLIVINKYFGSVKANTAPTTPVVFKNVRYVKLISNANSSTNNTYYGGYGEFGLLAP